MVSLRYSVSSPLPQESSQFKVIKRNNRDWDGNKKLERGDASFSYSSLGRKDSTWVSHGLPHSRPAANLPKPPASPSLNDASQSQPPSYFHDCPEQRDHRTTSKIRGQERIVCIALILRERMRITVLVLYTEDTAEAMRWLICGSATW